MRKMNSTMVTISWIVTVIFAILLLINWSNAAKIQTPYGSPASSLPYILGMLIGNGLIPGILWLITYFTAPKVNVTNNQKTSNGVNNRGHNNSDAHIMNIKIPSFTKSNSNTTSYIYHTNINGVTSEPLTYNQLKAKNINKDTYVWRNGIDWIKAGQLRELNPLFEQNGPPPFNEPKPKIIQQKPKPDFFEKHFLFLFLMVLAAIMTFLSYLI